MLFCRPFWGKHLVLIFTWKWGRVNIESKQVGGWDDREARKWVVYSSPELGNLVLDRPPRETPRNNKYQSDSYQQYTDLQPNALITMHLNTLYRDTPNMIYLKSKFRWLTPMGGGVFKWNITPGHSKCQTELQSCWTYNCHPRDLTSSEDIWLDELSFRDDFLMDKWYHSDITVI